MRNWTSASLLLALTTLAYGQARYRVYQGDAQIGEARISQRLLKNGGKFVEFVVILKRNGKSVEVRDSATLGPRGEPVREIEDVVPAGQPPERQVIATFDSDGANVVVKTHGVPSSRHVQAPTEVPRTAPYEFWFIRDKPRPGEHHRSARFNQDTLEWQSIEATYVGPAHGGHLVRMVRSTRTIETVYDAAGSPLSITDSKGLRIVRESPR